MARHPQPRRTQTPAERHRIPGSAAALLDPAEVAGLEKIRKVVCEPTRAQIIRALGPGQLSVQDLARLLGRTQPATSQHLRVLREMGVVDVERRGRQSYYHLTSRPLAAAAQGLLAAIATSS